MEIFQPDKGSLDYEFETTYTSDSTRVQSGGGHFQPMFTVEKLGYSATKIPTAKATEILQMIARGGNVTLHYYSLFYGSWRDAPFYVGKGSCKIGTLTPTGNYLESLSFNLVGVNPI